MGSSSSKFRKHLQTGDEYAALHLYQNNSDLRKGLDPNSSYGDNYSHDTPLHYAARHAMKSLLRIFLYDLSGNPNKENSRNETALHCVCMADNSQMQSHVAQQRRTECLTLILQWRGAVLKDGEVEKIELKKQDEKKNTALHYAASSGLKRCVELLVSQNAPLFMDNELKQTPCDCAEKSGHSNIALYLESKMVFSNEEENPEDVDNLLGAIETEEGYLGLRAQDLQEAKDQLLVETSDMLRVPLFTAEALLRNHEWSREMLLEAWMEDAKACCEKCGVVPPVSLSTSSRQTVASRNNQNQHNILEHDLNTPTHKVVPTDETLCDICACYIPLADEPVPMACDHQFCRECWERYLTGKIKEGDAHNITCPGYECNKLVPVEIIETLVSRDIARRYLQFDIKAFVESNPNIKWCPYPGCGRAVRLPDNENPMSPTVHGHHDSSTTACSHAVDCGNGHMFCWECLGEAHEPASCDNWKKWHQKIAEVKPEQMGGTDDETEIAANCLWLVTNSKPCPNCKSPIQKNEGCNHMKCSKCKHDFCWVCLEIWKKHSSATGGYFRCNRYEAVKKVEEYQDLMKAEAEAHNKKMQELNRFVHYYTRFKNHENSFKLEEPLVSTAKEKMLVLAKAVSDPDTANSETKFVEDAVHQLLKGRRVLKCSYVYGFYLEDTGYKKPIFEFMQTELEECTEALSEMIARPYLRTPRSKIIQTAHLVQRKRHEFVTAIAKGLVPSDSSPNMRKKRKKFSLELDDDLKKALLASLQDLDPANPWVKDPSGRHTNVAALLDWPEESDDSDTEPSPRPPTSQTEDGEMSDDDDSSGTAAECVRVGCSRPRAQNPRTGEIHDHCTMKCMRLDRMAKKNRDQKPEEAVNPEAFCDYQMDLLRALEMSRLQFLREMGQLRPGRGDRSPRSPGLLPHSPNIPRSPNGESRILSPEPELPGTLVLCDPPRGRRTARSSSGSFLTPGALPGHSEFDPDLQRALELSRLSVHEEDQDMKLAIELSLQEVAKSQPATPAPQDTTSTYQPAKSADCGQPLSADYSTIVTRVPNRSIEDLVCEGGGAISNTHSERFLSQSEMMGACGGVSSDFTQHHKTRSFDQRELQKNMGPAVLDTSSRPLANPFGLIKDISVNNILASDSDKTSAFQDKDFSQAFVKFAAPVNPDIEKVFEPRPQTIGGSPEDSTPDNLAKSSDSAQPPLTAASGDQSKPAESGSSLLEQEPGASGDQIGDDPTDSRPERGLEKALENLTTLSNTLSDVSDDLVIDSQMLESLLQGAEKYGAMEEMDLEDYNDVDTESIVLLDQDVHTPLVRPETTNSSEQGDEAGDSDNKDAKDAVFV